MFTFDSASIDEIVEARLEEVFEAVQHELKKAGRAGQLPSGVVLTGGTANLKGIAAFAKAQLGLAARVGKPSGFGGVADHIDEPQFAAVVGLMLIDADTGSRPAAGGKDKKRSKSQMVQSASGIVGKFLGRFKA